MKKWTFSVMNTEFLLAGLNREQAGRMHGWFRFVEARLSRFRPDSELSQLNQCEGGLFLASAMLYEVTQIAYRYFEETDRLYHPFLGREMAELGYDRSFEELKQHVNRSIFAPSRESGMADTPLISFFPEMKAIRLQPGVALDLGGVAKGWSVYKAQQWLQREGLDAGLIDGGGDIAGWGADGRWTIGVADPFHPEQDIIRLQMKKSFGLATSSRLKRSWSDGQGGRHHHLLDPRTRRPARSDLVQVTVLAPDVLTAEIYAKVLLILGSSEGIPWLASHRTDVAFLCVRQDGRIISSPHVSDYCLDMEEVR